MKELFLCRGVPGAGKSTLGAIIGDVCFAADDFHTKNGVYKWDANKVHLAHKDCIERTEQAMKDGIEKISVTNTFTKESEMSIYFELAKQYNYRVFSLVVENRHGGKNVHNVPDDIVNKMRERFQVVL